MILLVQEVRATFDNHAGQGGPRLLLTAAVAVGETPTEDREGDRGGCQSSAGVILDSWGWTPEEFRELSIQVHLHKQPL